MALKPVVLALSRSGETVAHRVAAAIGAEVHGRAGRVEKADAFFPDALAHARTQWKSLTEAGVAAQYWAQDDGRWVKKAASGD